MSKRTQEDASEERVTAKSKPMWKCSRGTAWGILTCLPRLHQKALWKPDLKVKYLWARGMSSKQEQGDLWCALAHQTTQYGTLTTSGLLKSGNQDTDKFVIDSDDMDSDTVTESNLSLKSQSLLKRMNDRLRKILDHSSKGAMQDIEKSSMIWWMFMSLTLEASVFIGNNYSENLLSIKNTRKDLTWKQMFDISEKLDIQMRFWVFSNQLGRFSMKTFIFGHWWRNHQSLACKGLCIFRFCAVSWKGESEPSIKCTVWEEQLSWFKDSPQYRTLNTIDGEPMEF